MQLRLVHLTVLLMALLMIACQPIQPVQPLTETPTATTSSGPSITESATLTTTVAITAPPSTPIDSTRVTTTSVTTTSSPPSTPSTGLATASDAATCPAITSENQQLDLFIMPDWQVGDQRAYLATMQRVDINNGDESLSLTSTTPITVTVLSIEEDGYILLWEVGQSQLGETDVEIPNSLAGVLETPLQVQFHYAVDRNGAYVGLLDIEDLQQQLEPIFDQLFELIAETEEISAEELEAAREIVARIIEDPSNFETLFTNDVQLLHALYGFNFETAAPLVLPDLRPNVFGGAPIASELTITPTHYDAAQGCLHVTLENIADPVAARNSILESLQVQAEQLGVPAPTEEDLPAELLLIDVMHFEVDLEAGWPITISAERTTAIGDQGREESATLRLVE